MSPALTLLMWSVALTFLQMLVAVSGASLQVGLPKLAGNRDDVPRLTGWPARAQRAHYNMLENMVLFATLGASPGLALILLALALSGLGMGIALPATSATMASEVHASEYGVMSAAQLMATQVGEVAGIQVVLTLQESLAHRAGLENVGHSPALLHSFQVAFWVGALGLGLVERFVDLGDAV